MTQVAAEYVQEGDSVDYTPSPTLPPAIRSSKVPRVGIAKLDIAANVLGALAPCGACSRCPRTRATSRRKGQTSIGTRWRPVGGCHGSRGVHDDGHRQHLRRKVRRDRRWREAEAVLLRLGSMDQTATIDMDHLSDVGTITHAAGTIIVGDGTKVEEVAVSGPLSLSAAGLLNIKTATVAAAGSTQADAAPITNAFTLVSAADATKGVKLPTAVAGDIVIVENGANAVLKIWPFANDAINALAANGDFSIATYTSVILIAYDATTWYSIPLLPS